MIIESKHIVAHIGCIIFVLLLLSQPVHAQPQEEMEILRLFYKEKDLVVSSTRQEKPISQVAENISVVTSEEIEMMNAHTPYDILNRITGVNVSTITTPGIPGLIHIHGSEQRHVLVTLDGMPLNNLSESSVDLGVLPVQNIERIEVIKGPASSSWGSSLGGLINIITKSPSEQPHVTVSSSYGDKNTGDFRASISGREKNLGYYLYTGHLQSDGLRPNTDVSANSIYTKIDFDVTADTKTYFSFGYHEGERGLSEFPFLTAEANNEYENYYAMLGLTTHISDNLELEMSLHTLDLDSRTVLEQSGTGLLLGIQADSTDETYGGSIKFTYKKSFHSVVAGSDISSGVVKDNANNDEEELDKWAVFINDTISFDRFTITPGLRYDYTNTNDDFVSPSIGATYVLGENTILRALVARGFSIPPLSSRLEGGPFFVPNPDLEMEKVWSYQAGMETSALKYLWVKSTLFLHDVRDSIERVVFSPTSFTTVNKDKIRRLGFEIETRTVPIHNVSALAGFVFTDIEDRNTGETVKNLPRYTWDLGLEYNSDTVRGELKGRYVWWNTIPATEGEYDAFVWDLNLSKSLRIKGNDNAELYVTAHNIFNASQYFSNLFKNPGRWIEGGIRVKL